MPPPPPDPLDAALAHSGDALGLVADRLAAARHVVVLTGAGVSAESGIPTFRDALTGHWAQHRPEDLATPEGFRRNPALVQGWYRARLAGVRRARPNAGHHALAALEARVPRLTLATQNVDGLHQRAGSARVLELHGRLDAGRCIACAAPQPLDDGPDLVTCRACGAPIRPGVVWFGEALPEDVLEAATEAAATCDVFLSVGTSGVVYPAAALPGHARAHGAFVAEVNPVPSDLSDAMDVCLTGPSGHVLPRLVARLDALRAAA